MKPRIITAEDYRSDLPSGIPPEVVKSVSEIVSNVRSRGNAAIIEYTEKFDRVRLAEGALRVGRDEIERSYRSIPDSLRDALARSAERIRRFQQAQLPRGISVETSPGVTAGVIFDPVGSAGLYVPGGRAAYPSTVLMTGIPAKVAGVERCALFTPPSADGTIPAPTLAAAFIAGIDEVYRVGGAQAIAAMAYGTPTIRKVEKVVGPGNIYVTAAKMLVSWDVAVDMPAGPSEVLIYAEEGANAGWVAADMVAQAEHDPEARALLVTPDRALAADVARLVEEKSLASPRSRILEGSVAKSRIVVVRDREEALGIINEAAPEHLQFAGGSDLLDRVVNAGAVFLGETTPVALGDYSAGTNHVLPTMGWSRRASPLSVRDFLRSREYVRCTREGLDAVGRDAVEIALSEGLVGHAESVKLRLRADG